MEPLILSFSRGERGAMRCMPGLDVWDRAEQGEWRIYPSGRPLTVDSSLISLTGGQGGGGDSYPSGIRGEATLTANSLLVTSESAPSIRNGSIICPELDRWRRWFRPGLRNRWSGRSSLFRHFQRCIDRFQLCHGVRRRGWRCEWRRSRTGGIGYRFHQRGVNPDGNLWS